MSFKERARDRRQDFRRILDTKAPCPACRALVPLQDAECSQCDREVDIEQQKRIARDAAASDITTIEEYRSFARSAQTQAKPGILQRRPSAGDLAAYGASYAAGVATTYVVGAAYIGRAAGPR